MRRVLPWIALGSLACQSDAPLPERAPKTASAAAQTASAATVGSTMVAHATPPKSTAAGVCEGMAVGSYACDGRKLFACDATEAKLVETCLDIERCDAEQAKCAPGCPEGMVYVPPTGPEGFVMGRNFMQGADGPRKDLGKGHRTNTDIPHRVVLTKPFCMDELETTVKEWKACMKDHGCRRPDPAHRFVTYPDHDDHPVNAVSFDDARYYCSLKDKTLPTEAQWEWAATGGDGRTYPWGDDAATCDKADYVQGVLGHPAGDAGCRGGGPSPVGSMPAGAKAWPDGKIHDLAGNVWEWCLDNYKPYPRKRLTDPLVWKALSLPHVVRGGGWNRSHVGIRASFRGAAVVDYRVPGLGFRCVMNPDQKALNERGWPDDDGKPPQKPKPSPSTDNSVLYKKYAEQQKLKKGK